ncbi:MAG: cardiolipin synthase B [Legionellales bacterium]|nr:cardiolipin synthase B [Legionellales bacterium]
MKAYTEHIFDCGDRYFDALIEDIRQAQTSIEIEIYAFQIDPLGQTIIETLIHAAQRGVHIRILVDGAGTPNWGGPQVQALDQAGIESKVFHPLPWRLSQFNRTVSKKPWITNIIHFLTKINSRNHRKIIIIDDTITYIGSRNIDQRHLSTARGGHAWRDTTIRLSNAPIEALKLAFETSWSNQSYLLKQQLNRHFKSLMTGRLIHLNDSHYLRRSRHQQLLKRIARAKERVWITSAYFIPNHFLLKKIKEAAHSGIDVRILVPHASDVPIISWASESFYHSLRQSGVRIFEYLPSMLHAKTLIIDQWVLVGTSNFNHRSILHDLEVDIALTDPKSRETIIQHFKKDLNHTQEILNPGLQRRPWIKRILGRLCLIIKYVI